jgi:hypothetical protein
MIEENNDVSQFGSFNRASPSDPHLKNFSYLKDGTPFSSSLEDKKEHDAMAEGKSQHIKITQLVNESRYYKYSTGDTPCLKKLLSFVRPLIRGDQHMRTCWRHLAKKCPGVDPFQEF